MAWKSGLMSWGFLGAIFLLAAACHPKEGTPCDTSDPLQCKGSDKAMACLDGAWREYNCFGPDGCWIDGPNRLIICDQSNAHEGDHCFPLEMSTGDSACSLDDPREIVQCDGEVFVLGMTCPEGTICVHGEDEYLHCEG